MTMIVSVMCDAESVCCSSVDGNLICENAMRCAREENVMIFGIWKQGGEGRKVM